MNAPTHAQCGERRRDVRRVEQAGTPTGDARWIDPRVSLCDPSCIETEPAGKPYNIRAVAHGGFAVSPFDYALGLQAAPLCQAI
jgi:hypothetical protein